MAAVFRDHREFLASQSQSPMRTHTSNGWANLEASKLADQTRLKMTEDLDVSDRRAMGFLDNTRMPLQRGQAKAVMTLPNLK